MRIVRSISCVDGHTCGHPVRLVQGGIPRLPGSTMRAKMEYFRANLDHLRRFLLFEPRGRSNMFAAVMTEPCTPDADLGLVFMSTAGYPAGCGHGSMGAAVMAVELGMVTKQEPITQVCLDVPAGLVRARVRVEQGQVKDVTIRNVPAFVEVENLVLDLPGYGSVRVDIAYGGLYWILVNTAELESVTIGLEQLDHFIALGAQVKQAVTALGLGIRHPVNGDDDLDQVFFYEESGLDAKVLALYGRSQFDRSPCGSGSSARLALLQRQGRLKPGESLIHQAMMGGRFICRAVEVTSVAGRLALVTDLTGAAFITGHAQFVLNPDDEMGEGFLPVPGGRG